MADPDTFGTKDWLRLLATVAGLVIFVLWPRLTSGITLLIIGSVAIAFNAMIFWDTVVCKGHAPAVAPFIGGIFAAIGIAVLPISESWKWAWIPLVIDWGGFPILLAWGVERLKS